MKRIGFALAVGTLTRVHGLVLIAQRGQSGRRRAIPTTAASRCRPDSARGRGRQPRRRTPAWSSPRMAISSSSLAQRGREQPGGVVALRDTNGDGRFDVQQKFGDQGGTGIALRNGYLYHAQETAIVRYPDRRRAS